MRLGVTLAQTGRLADPVSVRSAAVAAEQVGLSSVWVLDRPPAPAPDPFARDPLASERSAPEAEGRPRPGATSPSLDPLSVLAFAAAVTQRVRLGTGVLVTPWYRPDLLARSLASLAVLADGRLTVGLGTGGAPDDPFTIGSPETDRLRTLDTTLDRLEALVAPPSPSPVDAGPGTGSAGGGADLTGSRVPVRPPVLLACDTADGLERIARRADGWLAHGVPVAVVAPMWAALRDVAAAQGRGPDPLALVVRADITVTARPIDGTRPLYAGTVEQVAADLVDTRRAGAREIVLALQGDHDLDEALGHTARLAEAVDVTTVP
jgi:alkanesulfonate monooxygenase SsuD/methylene tetrahydromethanopterin reductase-like flavin-dependent oxidoreductase (luciferase family)